MRFDFSYLGRTAWAFISSFGVVGAAFLPEMPANDAWFDSLPPAA
jgi:hypothetical protein